MKKNFILLFACIIMLVFASCGGTSGEKSETDKTAACMTIVQDQVGKYLDDVNYSWSKDDWIITENEGNTSIVTHATPKDSGEKQLINVIVTMTNSSEYKTHFVEVGGTVYLDDETIE